MRRDGQPFRDHPPNHSCGKLIVLVSEKRMASHAVVRQADVRRIDAENDPLVPLSRPEICEVFNRLGHAATLPARASFANSRPRARSMVWQCPAGSFVKGSGWDQVSRPLEVLPDFRPMSRGYKRLHEWLAECFVAEPSAFSATNFYIQAFVLPRFVPTDQIYFDFGFRVGELWQEFTENPVASLVTFPHIGQGRVGLARKH